jgi:hypothetical protein
MLLSTVEKAIEFAKEKSIRDVLLIGGEPTLHPEVSAIVDLVNSAGLRTILTTNYSRPDVVRALDGRVACFNVSYYRQTSLPLQSDFTSDLTLHAIIHSRQLATKAELDAFIASHAKHGHLKFSTLVGCNEWATRHQSVPYLDSLDCEWVVLFNEILGQVYRGTIIKRHDRIINVHAHQSFKVHVDGRISQTWTRDRSLPRQTAAEVARAC